MLPIAKIFMEYNMIDRVVLLGIFHSPLDCKVGPKTSYKQDYNSTYRGETTAVKPMKPRLFIGVSYFTPFMTIAVGAHLV